jgi:hypothetical protein
MVDDPKTSEPNQDGGEDSAVPQATEQQGCPSKRNDTGKRYCRNRCCIFKDRLHSACASLKNRTAEQWIAIGTWVLACVTIGLLIDARHASERQLRAYVGILDHTLNNFSEGQKPAIALIVTNFGHTPARDMQYWIFSKFESYPLNIKLPSAKFRPEKIVLFPTDKDTFPIELADPLNAPDMAGLRSGERRLYVYGCIQYVDVFGSTRTTKFRLFYGGKDTLRIGRLAWAEEGNEAD